MFWRQVMVVKRGTEAARPDDRRLVDLTASLITVNGGIKVSGRIDVGRRRMMLEGNEYQV